MYSTNIYFWWLVSSINIFFGGSCGVTLVVAFGPKILGGSGDLTNGTLSFSVNAGSVVGIP